MKWAPNELTLSPDGRGFVNVSSTSTRLSQYYPHIIPLQFTGLKDKNGKEIYEGDVCVIGDAQAEKVVIEFIDGGFGHYWRDKPRETFCQMSLYPPDVFVPNGYCVIGNIYENPELLKLTNRELA